MSLCSHCGCHRIGKWWKKLLLQSTNRSYFSYSCNLENRSNLPLQFGKRWKGHKNRELSVLSLNVDHCNNLFNGPVFHPLTSSIHFPIGYPNIPGFRSFHTSGIHQNQEKPNDEDDGDDDNGKTMFLAAQTVGIAAVAGYVGYLLSKTLLEKRRPEIPVISWKTFVYDILSVGEAEQVTVSETQETAYIHLVPGSVIKGQLVDIPLVAVRITDPQQFERKVRNFEKLLGIQSQDSISIKYMSGVSPSMSRSLLATGALFLGLSLASIIGKRNPTNILSGARKMKFARADLQQNNIVKFSDVAGLREAKVEVNEFVDYLKNPQKFEALGAKIPKGALLLGPPGCGKTLLAKAIASESKVPFLTIAGSEFIEILGGLGAARVRDLFKEAKKVQPSLIFIDEIDAIGKKRGGVDSNGSGEAEQTLNQLLVEMDGINSADSVILLASTNRPDVLDKALTRPGRFDRHINIDIPTMNERKEIILVYLNKLKLEASPFAYIDRLAELSSGMSGADIANICNEAALHAAREKQTHIRFQNFDFALEKVVAGAAKRSTSLSLQERKVLAYHEAGHALVGWLLHGTDKLLRVSIIPRIKNKLGYSMYLPSDQKFYSKEDLFQRMCMSLGGRVAESLVFNSVTTAAQDDLKNVTDLALTQIQQLGFNDRVGNISFPVGDNGSFASKPYSKSLKRIIDQEAKLMVTKAYKETERLLTENKHKLRLLAEELLAKETLIYEDVEKLLGRPPNR